MYFKQIQEILDGTKTQTRRIVKPNEAGCLLAVNDNYYVSVRSVLANGKARQKWESTYLSDKTYAVQSGPDKPGVWWWVNSGQICWNVPTGDVDADDLENRIGAFPLRIGITCIWRMLLQSISEADAQAEGWPGLFECGDLPIPWFAKLWDSINTRKGTRWEDSPDVWVIEFEVKK